MNIYIPCYLDAVSPSICSLLIIVLSGVLSGSKGFSEVLSGFQGFSVVLKGSQWFSEVLKGSQRFSRVI